MTTDMFPKLRARMFALGARHFCMVGMDKGMGMIHPNMGPHATLLGCIVTDAVVSPHSLQSTLTYAVDHSFNSISIDGDMILLDMTIDSVPHDVPQLFTQEETRLQLEA